MEDDLFDIKNTIKIAKQVERWDLYAKITPPVFLLIAVLLVLLDLIEFDTLFYVGLGMFSFTAVVWWFWSIFTIRYIIKHLNRAATNLLEVRKEIKEISAEVEDLRNE